MAKRRHLTPQEIIAQCNAIAREKRMADRTPWTAMSIMCSYTIMKCEKFKEHRILRILDRVNEMNEQWYDGMVDLDMLKKRIDEKAGWTVGCVTRTEADITAKKGSYWYWLDSVQIAPQNVINEQATRFNTFFFIVLMDEFKFGKERLTRVSDYMNNLLSGYQRNKGLVSGWSKELREQTGIVIEMPIDPLTQTAGSLMTN